MYFVSFIVILAILFAYAEDKRKIYNGFKISFWLLTITMSLRYGYGNDYFSYMQHFYEINSCPTVKAAYEKSGLEIGWIVFSRLLNPFGFQSQIFVCSLILYGIYYYVIKKYVPNRYRWIGLMIFLLHDGLFILDISMIRQGLTGALFLLGVCLALKGKSFKSLIVCLLGVTIHSSAIICIPFLILIYLRKLINPNIVLLICIFACAGLLYFESATDYIFSLLFENGELVETYGKYLSSQSDGFKLGIGAFLQYVTALPMLYYYKYLKVEDKYFFILYFMVLLIIPLGAKTIMVLRLVSYFLPFAVILFPRFVDRNKVAFSKGAIFNEKRWHIISLVSLSLFIVYIFYSYISFFSSATYGFAYKNFRFCF